MLRVLETVEINGRTFVNYDCTYSIPLCAKTEFQRLCSGFLPEGKVLYRDPNRFKVKMDYAVYTISISSCQ